MGWIESIPYTAEVDKAIRETQPELGDTVELVEPVNGRYLSGEIIKVEPEWLIVEVGLSHPARLPYECWLLISKAPRKGLLRRIWAWLRTVL